MLIVFLYSYTKSTSNIPYPFCVDTKTCVMFILTSKYTDLFCVMYGGLQSMTRKHRTRLQGLTVFHIWWGKLVKHKETTKTPENLQVYNMTTQNSMCSVFMKVSMKMND